MSTLAVNNINGRAADEYKIRIESPSRLNINGTCTFGNNGQFVLPRGNSSQRPASPSPGMIRFNTEIEAVEYYKNSTDGWITITSAPPEAVIREVVTTENISVVQSGLVLHVDMGNPSSYNGAGTTVYDLSGNGNNGEIQNLGTGSIYTTANNLSYLSFDKTNSGSIEFPDNSTLDFGNQLTVSIWTSARDLTTWNSLWGHASSGSWTDGWGIYYNSNTTSFYVNNYSSYAANWTSGSAYDLTNITGVYNGSNVKIYVNGLLVQNGASLSSNVSNTNVQMGIGRMNPGSYYYSGDFRVGLLYNRALGDDEILANFNTYQPRYGIT